MQTEKTQIEENKKAVPCRSTKPAPDMERFPAEFREMYGQMLGLLPQGVFHYPPLPPYFTGYSCGTLYDWDQYFEAIILAYAGYPMDYIRNGIGIFLARQQEDGLIPRSVPRGGGATYYKHASHVKPFLAQETLFCLQVDGNLEWLRGEDRYERLKRYLHYWMVNLDVRGAGLSVWHDAGHTGMDNHYERAGDWTGENGFCEGVDLNSYLVRECRAMAQLATLLGHDRDAADFTAAAGRRSAAIQRDLWDEAEGFYYDRHARTNEFVRVKHAGAFAPMWAGVCSEDQAARLVDGHLLNPREFWRPYPIPALAASEPGYVEGFPAGESTGCCSWRAHTWLPVNYTVFHGLRTYGYHAVADELVAATWRMFMRGRFAEYYTSESGIGTGRKPFWGWTCLALFMPHEFELGIDPTSPDPSNHAVAAMRAHLATRAA